MAENPYAAPRTRVEDVTTPPADGDFIPEGRGVPAGNGQPPASTVTGRSVKCDRLT